MKQNISPTTELDMEYDNTETLFSIITHIHSGGFTCSVALTAIPICRGSLFMLYNSMHCDYCLGFLAILKRVRNNFRWLEGSRHKSRLFHVEILLSVISSASQEVISAVDRQSVAYICFTLIPNNFILS
jgi:hypothetical protein